MLFKRSAAKKQSRPQLRFGGEALERRAMMTGTVFDTGLDQDVNRAQMCYGVEDDATQTSYEVCYDSEFPMVEYDFVPDEEQELNLSAEADQAEFPSGAGDQFVVVVDETIKDEPVDCGVDELVGNTDEDERDSAEFVEN